jgi:hypothetical protein
MFYKCHIILNNYKQIHGRLYCFHFNFLDQFKNLKIF